MRGDDFVYLALLTLPLASPAARADVKTDFSAYVRAGLQFGKGLEAGEALHTNGFAKHNRLQEGQYLELSSATHLTKDTHFLLTLGNGGGSPHFTGTWPGEGFAIRNLYLAMDHLPDAPNVSLWFGSRMYRGNDIYLFDYWPLDNQNILGGGLSYTGGAAGDVRSELSFGAKRDTAYSTGSAAPNGASLTPAGSAQRYIVANKVEFPTTLVKRVKTNLELHVVPKGSATYASGGTSTNVSTPYQSGVAIGAQATVLDHENWFFNYGYGDVIGALNTWSSTLADNPTFATKAGSRAGHFGVNDALEYPERHFGVMYAAIAEFNQPNGNLMASAFTASIRPMRYLTEHFHVGVELDATKYFRGLTGDDVSYGQISPMIEYALNKNVFGSPKFRLIASNAFYSKEVIRYDSPTRSAFNIGMGFELWF